MDELAKQEKKQIKNVRGKKKSFKATKLTKKSRPVSKGNRGKIVKVKGVKPTKKLKKGKSRKGGAVTKKKKGKKNKTKPSKVNKLAKKKIKKEVSGAKNEAARRAQILVRFHIEERLCVLNLGILDKKWEEIMSDMKSTELLQDLQEMRENFNLYIHNKSEQLQLMMDDWQLFGQMRETLGTTHISGLENLIELYETQVNEIKKSFDQSVSKDKQSLKSYLKYLEEKENLERERETYINFQLKERRERERNRILLQKEQQMLDSECELWTKMEKVEKECEDAIEFLLMRLQTKILTFRYTTQSKRSEYEAILSKDAGFHITIMKQYYKTKKLKKTIASLRSTLEEVNVDKCQEVRETKTKAMQYYFKLKNIVKEAMDQDNNNLRHLCIVSDKAVDTLRRNLKTKEDILKLKSLCKGKECLNERRTVWSPEYRLLESEQGIWKLNGFYEHVGKAEVSKIALMEIIDIFKKDQVNLKSTLSDFLKNIRRR